MSPVTAAAFLDVCPWPIILELPSESVLARGSRNICVSGGAGDARLNGFLGREYLNYFPEIFALEISG